MGLVSGSGYFLIALGPALAIFISSIAPKPFLILTVLVSALLWLLSLIAASIIWRAFLPGPSWVFLPMVITAVALQEVVRPLYWRLFLELFEDRRNFVTLWSGVSRVWDQAGTAGLFTQVLIMYLKGRINWPLFPVKTILSSLLSKGSCRLSQHMECPLTVSVCRKVEKSMNVLATKLSKPQLNYVDRLEIALASGVGHGVVHSVFFGLSILSPSFGPATYYTQSCNHMPLFLVSALTTLAFFLLHTFSMIIAFNAYTYGNRSQHLFVPVMHLAASLSTLVNLLQNGCTAGVPLSFLCAVLTMAYGGKIVWDNVGPESLNHRNLQRIQLGSTS